MKSFDILKSKEEIFSSKLLEASAGTGKTFTIEHLVTRLLIEKQLRLSQILTVTFTRAAARDLRVRIRSCLEKGISALKNNTEEAPDYLKAILDKEQALNSLTEALFCFDEAQIFTIHGFCARALKEFSLEGNISLGSLGNENNSNKEIIRNVIKDYFRSGQVLKDLGKENFDALMEIYKLNYSKLEKELAKEIDKKIEFDPSATDLFTIVAMKCQRMLKQHLAEKEILGPDEWLKAMSEAVKNREFRHKLQSKFQAVVVDEFQDTDPEQWVIFETLFLDQEFPCPLYLVGDPKQSIYFFRQADIYTYLKAGQSLGNEAKASLATNFRSQPELVKALNVLFSPDHAPGLMPLPRLNSDLPYTPVDFSAKIKEKIFNDRKGAVHFIFSHNDHKQMSPLFQCMAEEIQRLHSQDTIPYKGIAILVKDKTQANAISQFMSASHIPITNQRATKIGNSTVIDEWRDILQAALNPKKLSRIKAAMGTRLIGWNHSDITALNQQDQLIALLLIWQNLNLKLQEGVGVFLEQFCSQTWKKEECTTLEQLLSSEGGLEHYQDFIQIGEILMEHQAATQAAGDALIAYLDELEQKSDESSEEKYNVRHDPNIDAVNLLTIHGSKGLEYEVVFAPGLMEGHKIQDKVIPVFHDSKLMLKSHQFEGVEFEQFAQELDAEKMRQLYVAMTRAKYRLYLPACWGPTKVENGNGAPMELFLSRLGQSSTDWKGLYTRIRQGVRESVETLLNKVRQNTRITYQVLTDENFSTPILTKKAISQLYPPATPVVMCSPIYIHSFTSLSKKAQASFEAGSTEEIKPPHDFQFPERNPHTLPSGSETGNLLHMLFEKIPFQLAFKSKKAEDLIPWVKNKIIGSEYKGWERSLAEILFQTFNLPLCASHGTFKLSEIDPAKSYREIEFLYPSEQGFLKGKIDCIIEHEGFHYILDWKSNWLGDGSNYYSEEFIRKAMQEHQYDLQAKIYTEAWERYCNRIEPNSFEARFGGVFYIFVRGPGALLVTSQGAKICKM